MNLGFNEKIAEAVAEARKLKLARKMQSDPTDRSRARRKPRFYIKDSVQLCPRQRIKRT